jgi:hypothetical protein
LKPLAYRIVASAALVVWLAALIFVAGPARWEFAHSYRHLVSGLGNMLPVPTLLIGLPVLGLGEPTPGTVAVRVLFWLIVWSGPAALLSVVWRVSDARMTQWLLAGAMLYGALIVLLTVIVVFSLLLPFGLLS